MPAGVEPEPAAENVSRTDGAAPPLEVGIRHASLEHAPYVLVVGHFAGAPLSGSEGRLDDRLGGRLTRLSLLNQYPRNIGEYLLLTPVDEDTPRGVLVLGLGPTGELTGTQLSAVMTRGLLRLANHHLEHLLAGAPTVFPPVADDVRRLGVSAVTIGTSSGGGLTVEGCVRALVAGVNTANDRLGRLMVPSGVDTVPASTFVRFDRLELIERYADRIDLLADALDRLGEQAERDEEDGTTLRVHYVAFPQVGEGASTANPPLDPGDEVWRRVGIAAIAPPPPATPPAPGATTSSAPAAGVHVDGPPGPRRATGQRHRADGRRPHPRPGHQPPRRPCGVGHPLRAAHPPPAEGRAQRRREPPPAGRRDDGDLPVGAPHRPRRGLQPAAAAGPAGRACCGSSGTRRTPATTSAGPPPTPSWWSATRRREPASNPCPAPRPRPRPSMRCSASGAGAPGWRRTSGTSTASGSSARPRRSTRSPARRS